MQAELVFILIDVARTQGAGKGVVARSPADGTPALLGCGLRVVVG